MSTKEYIFTFVDNFITITYYNQNSMKKLRIPKEVFEQSLNIPCCENRLNDNTQPRDWTIVSALNAVLSLAENSKLSEEFWELCKSPLEFLTSKLCLTKIQVIVIAILAETGESLSWRGIGKFLNCSRLTIMTYSDELEELLSKRWIVKKVAYDMGNPFEGFGLARGVVTALRHNRTFIPEKLDGLQIQEFIDKNFPLSILENKEDLVSLISAGAEEATEGDLQVHIGSENALDAMSNSSFVYRVVRQNGKVVGAVGVIGPRRMDYSRVIAILNQLSLGISGLIGTADESGDGSDNN